MDAKAIIEKIRTAEKKTPVSRPRSCRTHLTTA